MVLLLPPLVLRRCLHTTRSREINVLKSLGRKPAGADGLQHHVLSRSLK